MTGAGRLAGVALALLAQAVLAAPMSPIPSAEPPGFAERVVRVHNRVRAAVGVGPLVWDANLAADARDWAAYLARTNQLMHHTPDGPDQQGENLFAGTARAYDVETMIDFWARERDLLPDPTNWLPSLEQTGHYTQMVWRDTSRVGCSIASNGDFEFLVCRYLSAGNVMGEVPY